MKITERLRKTAVSGLTAVVMALGVIGCETTAGSDYNRTVNMPSGCEEVISAGFSGSIGYGDRSNTDWISCKDSQGNVTIYRMPKSRNEWYSTQIKR